METILPFLPLLGPLLTAVLMVIVVPYVVRIHRLHKAQHLMIKKKLFEHTGVVIFGVFDGQIQSDYLGGFLTTLFGEHLFDLIVGWNDVPSPSIITPRTSYEAAHMKEIMAAHASPYILQSDRLDCYFRSAERHGTLSYKFAKFVVGLARPDADKLDCHDYPRIVAIEEGALRKIVEKADIKPQHESQDGRTWLATLRELGALYCNGKRDSLTVLEIPLN